MKSGKGKVTSENASDSEVGKQVAVPLSDRAAERALRQAANRAEREARKAGKVAEREARKPAKSDVEKSITSRTDGSAKPVPAFMERVKEVPKPALLSKQAADFNILIVAQQGRLAAEAVLFVASLRRNAPGWRGRLIVAEPREDGAWQGIPTRLDTRSRALLAGYGAEVLPFTAQHFGQSYPYGNKIEALQLLPAGQPFVFFDSDTLVTGPLDRVAFDFAKPSASMRRSDTWPQPPLYGPDYSDIWKSLYDRFGLDFVSSLQPGEPDEHWERYLYFNAGWFFGADPQVFFQRFLEWALAIRQEPGDALACQSLDPWLDQIVLPLVVHSLGGGRPGPDLAPLDGAVTCHYRNLSLLYARESEAVVSLLEELVSDPQIAPLFTEDVAVQRLVRGGEGRATVRPMFSDTDNLTEKPLRHRLKQAELWFG